MTWQWKGWSEAAKGSACHLTPLLGLEVNLIAYAFCFLHHIFSILVHHTPHRIVWCLFCLSQLISFHLLRTFVRNSCNWTTLLRSSSYKFFSNTLCLAFYSALFASTSMSGMKLDTNIPASASIAITVTVICMNVISNPPLLYWHIS